MQTKEIISSIIHAQDSSSSIKRSSSLYS